MVIPPSGKSIIYKYFHMGKSTKTDTDSPPKKINSRKKGARNERKVADLFKTWTGVDFARTPGSGGLRWKGRTDVVGDIVCTDERHAYKFPFTIEAKFHAEIEFNQLVGDRKKCEVIRFWEQATRDAVRAKKSPLLIMRYNQMQAGVHFIGMELTLWSLLQVSFPEMDPAEDYGLLLVFSRGYQMAIMDSRYFFKLPYNEVKKIVRKYNKTKENGN